MDNLTRTLDSSNNVEKICSRNYSEMLTFLLATTLSFLSNAIFSLALRKLNVYRENKFHLVVKIFAISNTFVVAPLLPMSIASYAKCRWLGGHIACTISGVISAIFLGWSVSLVVILCFYRYLAICKPFYYRTRLTAVQTKVIVTVAFIWNMVHLSPPAFGLGRFEVRTKGWYCSIALMSKNVTDMFVVYVIIAEGIFYTLVLGYLYVTVCKVIKKERRAWMHLSPQQYHGSNVVGMGRKLDEFARMTLLIAVVYWSCSFPYFSYRALFLFSKGRYQNSDAYFYTQVLAYFNPFLNIVVFLTMNEQYRKAMTTWLGLRTAVIANNQQSNESGPQDHVAHTEIEVIPTPVETHCENIVL